MTPLLTPAHPHAARPPVDPAPAAHTPNDEPAAGPAPVDGTSADELSDDDLESVVGGLARTWTDALRASRHHV